MFTLIDKINYLKSKNLLNDSQEIEAEIFPQFVDLLYKFRDIFAHSAKDITECNVMKCELLLEDNAKPSRCRPYRLSDDMRKVVDAQLDELLESGVIAESDGSQFASPIVIVKKRDGSARFCSDMRRLNQVSKPLYHELPLLEDIIDVITRNKAGKLSLIDLRSAYHQIKVSDKSSYQTTFVTPHRGAYRYLRLPQGHRQSPYYMSLVLNKLFRREIGNFLIIYLDDLLTCSENSERHLEHLRIVFERFRQGNLKLHPSKCHFFQHTVKYLGFIFSSEGVRSDPDKTAAIRAYPTPKKQKDVRSFLGMTNYLRRYIKGYSEICHPLYRLLQKDVEFQWTEAEETAFQTLKNALCNPPILALPDFDQEFILTCDASNISISFNLSMIKDGKERFISFGGRGLHAAEKNYSSCERELLAIVVGVQHFHEFLAPKPFVIRTDNLALKYLNSVKNITGRLGRWNLVWSSYTYRVEHIKGKKNIVADRLSRIELPVGDKEIEETLDNMVGNINAFPDEDSDCEDLESMSNAELPSSFEQMLLGRCATVIACIAVLATLATACRRAHEPAGEFTRECSLFTSSYLLRERLSFFLTDGLLRHDSIPSSC